MTMPIPHPEHFDLYDQTLSMAAAGLGLDARVEIVQLLVDLGIDLIEIPAADEQLWAAVSDAPGIPQRTLVAAIDIDDSAAAAQVQIPARCEQICLSLAPAIAPDAATPLIRRFVDAGLHVIVDLADFFIGLREDQAAQRARLNLAAEAGAPTVVLCDSAGGELPAHIEDAVQFASHTGVNLGVAFNNDADCAVANTLLAADTGATLVKGCLTGIGPRAGRANLASIIANLQLNYGWPALPPDRIGELGRVSKRVADLMGESINPRQPFVGSEVQA